MLYIGDAAMQHLKLSRYLRGHNRKEIGMNKIIPLLTVLTLSTPAFATEYKSDEYNTYGYAAGASTINGTGLKAGLRGSHVAANHHKENSYYPGYHAIALQKE